MSAKQISSGERPYLAEGITVWRTLVVGEDGVVVGEGNGHGE